MGGWHRDWRSWMSSWTNDNIVVSYEVRTREYWISDLNKMDPVLPVLLVSIADEGTTLLERGTGRRRNEVSWGGGIAGGIAVAVATEEISMKGWVWGCSSGSSMSMSESDTESVVCDSASSPSSSSLCWLCSASSPISISTMKGFKWLSPGWALPPSWFLLGVKVAMFGCVDLGGFDALCELKDSGTVGCSWWWGWEESRKRGDDGKRSCGGVAWDRELHLIIIRGNEIYGRRGKNWPSGSRLGSWSHLR